MSKSVLSIDAQVKLIVATGSELTEKTLRKILLASYTQAEYRSALRFLRETCLCVHPASPPYLARMYNAWRIHEDVRKEIGVRISSSWVVSECLNFAYRNGFFSSVIYNSQPEIRIIRRITDIDCNSLYQAQLESWMELTGCYNHRIFPLDDARQGILIDAPKSNVQQVVVTMFKPDPSNFPHTDSIMKFEDLERQCHLRGLKLANPAVLIGLKRYQKKSGESMPAHLTFWRNPRGKWCYLLFDGYTFNFDDRAIGIHSDLWVTCVSEVD